MEYINLEKIEEEVKRYFLPFCDEIQKINSGNIISIVICGSAVSGDYVAGKSDINSVVIFREYLFDSFRKSAKTVNNALKRNIAPPLFLTVKMIKESVDVFPMEFSEIKENNIVIFGEDIFGNLEISVEHLRLQCEQQVKGKLLLLRQAYLETGGNGRKLESLMVDSISSVFPILRAALALRGIKIPSSKDEVLSLIENEFELSNSVMRDILKDKKGDGRIGRFDAENAFSRYVEEIRKISEIVNDL